MRRQWISLLTGVMTAAALVGCGAFDSVQTSGTAGTATAVSTETTQGAETSVTGDTRTADTAEGVSTQSEETASSGSRILVLYFDQGENSEGAGDTEVDAITSASLYRGIPDGIDQNDVLAMKNEIVSRTGADEYAVRINEKYAPAYEDMVDQAADDQDDDKQFTFESDLPDLSAYDTIFVGEPVWWGGMPQPMVNVFEQLDFSGKTIIPFGIHLGSGFGRILSQMEAMEPDAVVSDDGLTINGHTTNDDARSQVDEWLTGLGY